MHAHYILIPDQDPQTESEMIRVLRLQGYAGHARGASSMVLARAAAIEDGFTLWRKDAQLQGATGNGKDERTRIQERLALLTAREDQVLRKVVDGRMNKQI